MSERIPLRSLLLRLADGTVWQGIALPDDRFIFHGNRTYSSERVMLALNPGATIEWTPRADKTINHVMPEDELPDERA